MRKARSMKCSFPLAINMFVKNSRVLHVTFRLFAISAENAVPIRFVYGSSICFNMEGM
jgi:hypothetical protein